MKILVAIASYGTGNDRYLAQLVNEYRSMPFDVDIVVLSNIHKTPAPGVECVVVDLRGKNPWSLPFPHKRIFADRLDRYDLFIYSEDDTPITEKNIRAFLEVSGVLPENEIAGFLRFENGPDGSVNYPEIHGHFHWDPQSVRSRGGQVFAHFTNEHSACYILTRQQLQRAIASCGFLVEPHEAKYDLLCSAATDPYTQCGFQKLICVSRLQDFVVRHLPGKYVGTRFGVDEPELRRQVDVLLRIGRNGHRPVSLFETETKLPQASYSKDYYEPVKSELLELIPPDVRSLLSIGCGWGSTEKRLAEKGMRVVAVPLDPIIPGGAEAGNLEVVNGDFAAARSRLSGHQFDCLLLSNVLHLVRDPVAVLGSFGSLLKDNAVVVALLPNLSKLRAIRDRLRGTPRFSPFGTFETTGVQLTSRAIVRSWVRNAGMTVEELVDVLPANAQRARLPGVGLLSSLFTPEFIVVAKKVGTGLGR